MAATTTETEPTADQGIWTIPNALSLLRLLGVPLFLWLALGPHADGWAVIVLMVAGVTDYLDGKIARRFNQFSRIGAVLDPAADRLYILAAIIALTVRHIVPWWLAALLVARDLVLAPTIPVLRRHGYGPLPVHFIGKAATLNLLYALPLLLLAAGHGTLATVCRPVGWAFTVWGAALYWVAAYLYVLQFRQVVAAAPEPGEGAPA
ncbi:MAG TPA: CDP-alcohol phosphatidyltransferase family protein [Amnibacterium sp.]|nr:CDP-alcohol phosphatidyltransferase family protein [Amnibacterium sp.]